MRLFSKKEIARLEGVIENYRDSAESLTIELAEKKQEIVNLIDQLREQKGQLRKFEKKLNARNAQFDGFERQLLPYLKPRTKMFYKVRVGDDVYDVVADFYRDHNPMHSSRTEFFLGEKRVADFSKVDEIIGFDYDSHRDNEWKNPEMPTMEGEE